MGIEDRAEESGHVAVMDAPDAIIRAGTAGSLLLINDRHALNHYQYVAVEQSRLGIPLLIDSDVIHGSRTISPILLAEACTRATLG